jgi:molybdate transport system substrate-binding protein
MASAPRRRCAKRGSGTRCSPISSSARNVSQAAAFALSGNAQGGIIAYSLALAPDVASRGTFALVPEAWHEPLLQRMVLLGNAGPVAEAFYAYMQAPAARDIMERYGFVLPDLPAGG